MASTGSNERTLIRKFGNYALTSGWLRSASEKSPVDESGLPLPWYTYPAIRFLQERVQSGMNVFEFGSGNSTLWWADRVKSVTSVEHDQNWSEIVKNRIPENVLYKRLDLVEGGEYSQFAKSSGRGPFDIVAIDGRDRVNCALNCMSELKDDGVIIFDNADRRRYRHAHSVLQNNKFRRLKFIGIGALTVNEWDTSIFYRPDNCLGI